MEVDKVNDRVGCKIDNLEELKELINQAQLLTIQLKTVLNNIEGFQLKTSLTASPSQPSKGLQNGHQT